MRQWVLSRPFDSRYRLALDGTYRGSEDDGKLRFHPAPPPESEELDRVLRRVIRGMARILEREGLADEPDRLSEDDPLLAQLLAASVQGRTATGPRAGQKLLRFGDRVELAADANVAQPKTPELTHYSSVRWRPQYSWPALEGCVPDRA